MIVIAFYVVPFITGTGKGERGCTWDCGAIMEFYLRSCSCCSCARFLFFYYWCCYIPFEKCLLRVLQNFCFRFFCAFFAIFLGISLWLFVLVQAAIGFNLSLLILNANFN